MAQEFWGLRYIDDAVARRVDGDADGSYTSNGASEAPVPGEGTWYDLTDVQFSVVAVIDEFGAQAERVAYDALPATGGRARHRWPTGLDGDGDSDGNDFAVQLAAASTTIHGTNDRPEADHDRA